ncbi:hypothetical protein M6D93_03265 [Jatrophihabitans telluris]|uniref:Glycosyltransferase family 2 protein n=1 Tax=Jatrophihabitans telluris TaxID=2038343 RepID=A0ABY4R0I9_9ACTN|nr:hypothetical protein [Jatrophihabitans telluris]UQX89027.1 hypothetical protein M6D93_03265 [Jatrophihabitans telluris]
MIDAGTAVITIAAGRHDHLTRQRQGLRRSHRQPDLHLVVSMGDPQIAAVVDDDERAPRLPTEVVHVDVPGSGLPLGHARNAGARRAIELGASTLIFLDVDCIPGDALVERYSSCVQGETLPTLYSGTVGYLPPPPATGYLEEDLAALAEPHPARPVPGPAELIAGADPALFWSLSFAVSSRTWQLIGGFCEAYLGYGAEDTDFGQLARARAVGLTWVGGAPAYHQHHASQNPPVDHLADILRNGRIFRDRWGWWPMGGWLDRFETMGLIRHDRAADDWLAVAR